MEDLKVEESFENSRSVLAAVLKDFKVVLNKSMLPKCVIAKDLAWEEIKRAYMKKTGKFVTVEQLKKILQNMKTAIKKKTDKTTTGNIPIKLLKWEKDFLELLDSEDNPVFQKVPGAVNVGVGLERPATSSENSDTDGLEKTKVFPGKRDLPEQKGNRVKKVKLSAETEDTAQLTTAELQRWLLLEQIKLTQIQVKKEELLLQKALKEKSEEQTFTFENSANDMSEFIVISTSPEATNNNDM